MPSIDPPQRERIFEEVVRKRYVVAAVTALFLAIGVLKVLFIHPGYVAETVLFISSVPTESDTPFAKTLPEAYNPRVYESMAMSSDVLGATLDALIDGRVFEGDPPDLIRFRRMLSVETQLVDQTTRPMNYAPLLVLTTMAETPQRAVAILDAWAANVTASAKRAGTFNVAPAQELLEDTKEEYFQKLETNWQAQYEQTAEADPELLREEMEMRVQTMQQTEEKLVEGRAKLASARESLTAAETALAEQPRFFELRRAPGDTAFWLSQQVGEATGEGPAAAAQENPLSEAVMVTEVINPEYTRLQQQLNTARENMASGSARVEALTQELADLTAAQDEARKRLADAEMTFSTIDTQLAYLRKAFQTLADQEAILRSGKVLAAGQVDDLNPIGLNRLSPISFATEQERPLSGKAQVVLAGVLGLVLGAGLVVGRLYWNALASAFGTRSEAG